MEIKLLLKLKIKIRNVERYPRARSLSSLSTRVKNCTVIIRISRRRFRGEKAKRDEQPLILGVPPPAIENHHITHPGYLRKVT